MVSQAGPASFVEDVNDLYFSDADSAPEEIFDAPEDRSEIETNASSIEDTDYFDVEDQLLLFEGNEYSREHYLQAIEQFNADEYKGQNYSDGTNILIDGVGEKWALFCEKIMQKDTQECLESIKSSGRNALALLFNFFDWRLNQKLGKDGKKLRGIKKKSSLETEWKLFRLLFQRQTHEKIDPSIGRGMHKVLYKLAKLHGLSSQKRMNRRMTIEDLEEQIEETISTDRKSFKLGELRILAVLFLLLIAPAGSRPQSVLRMRFSDISLALSIDPEGGPPNILIRFTLEFTKTYLGLKEAICYPIPETMGGESFFLSPHIFLLGILFRHRAFLSPDLASPEQLASLQEVHPGEKEIRLFLRDDIQGTFIFRRAVKVLVGFEISDNEPITYGMMADWIRCIGKLLGIEYDVICYSLRYNAVNEMDENIDVSEALRNLAAGHKSSEPFQNHYLSRQVGVDVWAIIRGKQQQRALIKQSCSISHSRSKRRPITLTTEQVAEVHSDPIIQRLERSRQRHSRGSEEYEKYSRQLRNEKQRLERAELKKVREEWTAQQSVKDIALLLRGEKFPPPVTVKNDLSSRRPAQKRLIEALKVKVQTVADYLPKKIIAITAVMEYCRVQEGAKVQSTRNTKGATPTLDQLQRDASKLVMVNDEKERPRTCFLCVGEASQCKSDDPIIAELTHEFHTSSALNKHFRLRHLTMLQEHEPTKCVLCCRLLEHKQELLTHAQVVHGIHLRPENPKQRVAENLTENVELEAHNSRARTESGDRGSKRSRLVHDLPGNDKLARPSSGPGIERSFPATQIRKRHHHASTSDTVDGSARASKRQTLVGHHLQKHPSIEAGANKRQKLDCALSRDVRSNFDRGHEHRGHKCEEESRGTNHQQRLAGNPPTESNTKNRRAEHGAQTCASTTAATNADDIEDGPSKRQKRTRFLTPTTMRTESEQGDLRIGRSGQPRRSSNGFSTHENRPAQSKQTVGRQRAGTTGSKLSRADTKTRIESDSDGESTKTALRHQPPIRQTLACVKPLQSTKIAERTPGCHGEEAVDHRNAQAVTSARGKVVDPTGAKGERKRVAFTEEQNMLLIRLRDTELMGRKLSWEETHRLFSDKHPGRSKSTLQVHYSTKLSSLRAK